MQQNLQLWDIWNTALPKKNEMLEFYVRDTGFGIPKEKQKTKILIVEDDRVN